MQSCMLRSAVIVVWRRLTSILLTSLSLCLLCLHVDFCALVHGNLDHVCARSGTRFQCIDGSYLQDDLASYVLGDQDALDWWQDYAYASTDYFGAWGRGSEVRARQHGSMLTSLSVHTLLCLLELVKANTRESS